MPTQRRTDRDSSRKRALGEEKPPTECQSEPIGLPDFLSADFRIIKILFITFYDFYTICAAKLQKGTQINPRQARKSGAEGESLNLG